jgi:outer membrane protein assembly factor BamB
VVGSTLYVGSDDGNVYALNAADGTVRWSRFIGGEIEHSPTVSGDTLYVGNFTGSFYLFALDANTGARKWRSATGGYLDWNTPAVVGSSVFVASVDGEAYAYDAATGTQQWQVTLPNLVEAAPAVANGIVYVGTYDGNLYALDAATGDRMWRGRTTNLIAGTACVANDVVYVGSTDNHVYAFDAQTGAKLWTATLGGPVQFSQPVVVNGHLFVSADRLHVFGLP